MNFFLFFLIILASSFCTASPRSSRSPAKPSPVHDFQGFGEGFFILTNDGTPLVYEKSIAHTTTSNLAAAISYISTLPSFTALKIQLVYNDGISYEGFISFYERSTIFDTFRNVSNNVGIFDGFLDHLNYWFSRIESNKSEFFTIKPTAKKNSPTSVVQEGSMFY